MRPCSFSLCMVGLVLMWAACEEAGPGPAHYVTPLFCSPSDEPAHPHVMAGKERPPAGQGLGARRTPGEDCWPGGEGGAAVWGDGA